VSTMSIIDRLLRYLSPWRVGRKADEARSLAMVEIGGNDRLPER
jgi:hypothetical protein